MKNSIIVQNLKCGGCAKTITTKISEIDGIENIAIDIENSIISFTSVNDENTFQVKNKLKLIGYPTIDDENTLVSKAKSFVSCATGKMSS